eukprot:5487233-Prymnesium_polylepis.2
MQDICRAEPPGRRRPSRTALSLNRGQRFELSSPDLHLRRRERDKRARADELERGGHDKDGPPSEAGLQEVAGREVAEDAREGRDRVRDAQQHASVRRRDIEDVGPAA